MDNTNVKSLSDVLPKNDTSKPIKKMFDLVDKEIVLISVADSIGEWGPQLQATIKIAGDETLYSLYIKHVAISKKIVYIREKGLFPVRCKVIKVKNYYDIQ